MMTSARAAPANSAVDAIASSTLSFIVEGIVILLSMKKRRAARPRVRRDQESTGRILQLSVKQSTPAPPSPPQHVVMDIPF
jgi:hypothetical protein